MPCEALDLFYNPVMSPEFVIPDSSIAVVHLPCTGTNYPARQASLCTDATTVGSGTCVGLIGVESYSSALVSTEVKATACPIFNVPTGTEPSLACPPCVLERFEAGHCAPGSYDVTYSYVLPDLDAPEPFVRRAHIHPEQSLTFEQLISASMEISLLSDISDYSATQLQAALRHVLDNLWPDIEQDVQDQFHSIIQMDPSVNGLVHIMYMTMSPTQQSEWLAEGNDPSVISGTAWLHGMVSNSNVSVPWLDVGTISLAISSAMASAVQAALTDTRSLRITWLELGLANGGILDAFETTTTTSYRRVGDFQSTASGAICPLWTDEQLLELSADVISQQVADALGHLRVTSQGARKALPILEEIDSIIKMQSVGAAWCGLSQDSAKSSQVLSLDLSSDLNDFRLGFTSSITLALLAGSKQSECLERLNELTLLQAGALASSADNQAFEQFSSESVAIHDAQSQVVWQLAYGGAADILTEASAEAAPRLLLSDAHNSRDLLDTGTVHQRSFDIDNSELIYPAALGCVQKLQQDGCASIPRVFGHDRSSTKIMGGVLMHQTRSSGFECHRGLQQDLSFRCNTQTRQRGLATQVRSCQDDDNLSLPERSFGSEPARNARSAFFNPLLEVKDFYNTSNYPIEVDCRGEPRPFQRVDLPGYGPGHLIVFEACADAAVTLRALEYVRDSR